MKGLCFNNLRGLVDACHPDWRVYLYPAITVKNSIVVETLHSDLRCLPCGSLLLMRVVLKPEAISIQTRRRH